jgi:hypothetical protein
MPVRHYRSCLILAAALLWLVSGLAGEASRAAGDYEAARRAMVSQQLVQRGIKDPRVLAAMSRVDRQRFVPPGLAALA